MNFTWKYGFIFQGFKSQAMAVTCDPEHKFELALQLGDLKIAYQLANEAEVKSMAAIGWPFAAGQSEALLKNGRRFLVQWILCTSIVITLMCAMLVYWTMLL